MTAESENKVNQSGANRTCLACGKEFSIDTQFCPTDGSPLTPLNVDPFVGTFFADRYQIIEVLGRGGMSAVYKAKHILMDRLVAIKILVSSDVSSLKRFQLEAKLVSNLKHRNIVTVFDFGVSFKGQPYLVMDYLQGSNLMQEIRKHQRIELARGVKIFTQAADALSYAHRQELIHRDIKPSNFMLVQEGDEVDVVKVVDFGIAKQLSAMSQKQMEQLTKTGQILGSPLYMSPEQCMGHKLDARSDVYSLGCVMYESLTGKPPILGANTLDTLQRHIHDTPLAFIKLDPDLHHLPEHIERIVLKCLQREPSDRYQTMQELFDDLREFNKSMEPASASAASTSVPASKQSSMYMSWIPVAAAVSTMVAAAIMFYFFYPKQPVPQPEQVTPQAELWKKFNEVGEQEFERGQYAKAAANFSEACDVAEEFDKQDPRYATSLNNLGNAQYKQDLYAESESTIKKALDIRTGIFGQNGLPIADSLNDLAMVYFAENKIGQAEPLLNRAMAIRKSNAGSNSLEYAESLKSLASIYLKTGRVDDATKLLQTALAIRKKHLGANSPEVAETENSLAIDFQMKGDLKQARTLYKDAQRILTKSFGADHPLVADSLVGLGTIDYVQSNYAESESLLNQALKIREKSLGEKNLRTGEVLSCLGILKEAQGKASVAVPLFKKAMEIKREALGADSPDVAKSMKLYAQALKKSGQTDEANRIEQRVKELQSRKS
ncbi:MAG TPA: serine/threonine-protein kinase [Drouetiella sp.]